MDGKALVTALRTGALLPRPPYIPVLGRLAQRLGQVDEETFTTDAQVHATVLIETATALGADAITVGVGTSWAVGADAVARLQPLLRGRAVVACMSEVDVAGARTYCEAGVDMLVLLAPDRSNAGHLRTLAKACGFYQVSTILLDPALPQEPECEMPAFVAESLGLHGAIVAEPTGKEPGIVGGGLSAAALAGGELVAPRVERFFWTFSEEVAEDFSPEDLVTLGARLKA